MSLVLDYVFTLRGLFFLLFVRDVKQRRSVAEGDSPVQRRHDPSRDTSSRRSGKLRGTAEHAVFHDDDPGDALARSGSNVKPLIRPLEERFIQQISPAADIGVDVVHEKARGITCRTRQTGVWRSDWTCGGSVPLPVSSAGARWANGLQAANIVTFVTHVTHAVAEVGVLLRKISGLSNCTERPVWRVMLWYSNPYHFLSGWVEASITNGEPSQKDKVFGGEHPMWLVTCRSPMLSRRDGQIGPGRIDTFFDEWLPTIVNEVRRLARGAEYAASMHQEVVSKDGLSRPAATVGMDVSPDAPGWSEEGRR